MNNMPEKKKKPQKKVSKAPATSDIASVKGMSDIHPKDGHLWQEVIKKGFTISALHDFHYTETPPIEKLSLFTYSKSKKEDVETKRLYTFSLKGEGKVVLRPGGRVPALRSYHEHHLGYFSSPLKTFTFGSMVRRPKARSNRPHQVHEWSFNIIGEASDPFYDLSILAVALHFLKELKIGDPTVAINMGGCRTCREQYKQKLRNFYSSKKKDFCKSCTGLVEKEVLKCFRCNNEKCVETRAKAPIILDYLCQSCNNHFKALLEFFEDNGFLYEPDPYLFNDFEGCNKAVVSIRLKDGREVARGGRYDYLMEFLCKRQVPVSGISIHLDKVVEILKEQQVRFKGIDKVFFVAVGERAKKVSIKLINILRNHGIGVGEAIGKKSLKAQLKAAEKSGTKIAVIVGQKEVFEETAIIRNLKTGAQETVTLDRFIERVKRNLKKA